MKNPSVQPADMSREPNPSVTWFADLIPELDARAEGYRTSLEGVDDQILDLFGEQLRLAARALSAAVAAGSFTAIREQAHSLTGMGGAVGVPEISVVGDELSRQAKQGNLARCGELADRLSGWLVSWTAGRTALAAAPVAVGAGLNGHILIVDDERPNRVFLRKLLTANGARVVEAANGAEALEQAGREPPDLALVDVNMPGISGYEVCQSLTRGAATAATAVIMVTARSTVEDVERAFSLGAFDYIRKPFHTRELLARVRHALQIKQQNDALRQWQARLAREMELAGALQRKLLSTRPFFQPSFEVRSAYQSSQSVGGDVFETIALPDGRVCIYVGDVSGHGVGPALISTLLKALVNEVARELFARGPAVMCTEIQRRFHHYVTNPEIYATLFIALLDPAARSCVAYNCGHPMPLVYDSSGNRQAPFPDRGGLPIGLLADRIQDRYRAADEITAVLPPGGSLFILTDGLLEARRTDSAAICAEADLSAVLAEAARDPDIIDPADYTRARLEARGYALREDDCTLVVVRCLDRASQRLERAIGLNLEAVDALALDVEQCLLQAGWPEEAAGAARLLAMEHGVNVVEHAHAPPDSRLELALRLTARHAWLIFQDAGPEWDYQERLEYSERQPLDSSRGRGLRMIQAIAVHIDMVRAGHKNVFQFVINRDFSAGQPAHRSGERANE
ncbi:MAG: SpoIIE family protein phosphatase [Candidatus Marinimicrobia bacterium]|nr:SpoIIE family protein phosphatase [Candidatus Neomarinimicrobiota bacterium]